MLPGLFVLAACLCAVTLSWYWKQRLRWADDIPRARPTHRWLGNVGDFLGKSPGEVFLVLDRHFRQHDRLFTLRFGSQLAIGLTHPELVQKVLTHPDCQAKPDLYKVVRLPNGLLAAKYDVWKVHRKTLNSTFNARILESFVPIFNDCTQRLVGRLDRYARSGDRCNILEYISACTLEMISRTSLGGKVLEREGAEQFIANLEVALKTIGVRIFNIFLHIDFIYQFTALYRKEMRAINICQQFTSKIIQAKREEIGRLCDENSNQKLEPEQEHHYRKPQIFIDQLMKMPLTDPSARHFSDEEISDHIYTMIVAGNETSATQLAHTCLLLAMHPHIQTKAYEEVAGLVFSPDQEITIELMKDLHYLECVLKEAMRLMPVAPIVGRQSRAEIVLDGHRIPQGSVFLFHFYALHRRKDVWGPTADEFEPGRFLADGGRHPYAHLPFSGGPRGCIGYRYAMMSLKTLLAQLLRNYELTTELRYEDIRYQYQISLNLAFPHAVQLRRRAV
ncbi:probable cytochrome P450 313a4 [Anopheles gambiae]|uniref:Cytochrome P450 n=1 Tax=Anopheles coluzzii TaxID=1518534 RepID=A0A6E8VB89_ANOCL|nr:probable cytochrome P450 313a4 [Anopheles coluzzii]XP_312384.5 probable cytochrome P450 313a4 [Anopheles gambiae]